jgi:outer membrane PBP1 activator LpoA protein
MNACALVCARSRSLFLFSVSLKLNQRQNMNACALMCVCVCVRERERERERDLVNQVSSQLSVEQQARSHLCLWLLKLPWSHQHFQ